MKNGIISAIILLLFGFQIAETQAQTSSASDNLIAQPIPDRTVAYDISGQGTSLPITWGLDLAWLSEGNIRRGLSFMGSDRVDVVRSSFIPTDPIVNSALTGDALTNTNLRLSIIDAWLGSHTQVVLNCDHPSIDASFSGNASAWAELIDVTTRMHQDIGRTVITVSPFNEPDNAATGQGTITDFYNIAGELRNNSLFNNIRISGGNTLNCDEALNWYNTLQDRLDEGNTHQLAGSFNSYASFYQAVRANGHHATNDELHNVMEAMVGVEYGLQTGIWWGTAELARGEFVKASDGVRLGYAEHRSNWTAASVYRNLDGKIQAFGGTSERQAATTTYRFVSTERDVYYDGYGPQREYTMVMPGGTAYQTGQTNAERVVNITWGDDIQPVIDGQYILVNRNSGKVMEIANGSSSAGANLQQGTYSGATYQQWNVTPVDSRIGGDFSYFTLTALNSGLSPDILNWSLDDGGNVVVYDDTKGTNQQWYLEYVEDGWFYIRSRHSAKCLDVHNASSADGANIVQWDPAGGTYQQWRFLPVGASIEFTAPGAPSNLTATANAESIQLDWTASSSSDVAGYTIFRATSSGGSYNTIARNVTTTSFVDNTATTGGPYYYVVKAVDNSLNRSSYSNEASATPTGNNALVAQLQFDGSTLDNSVNLNHCATYGSTSYVSGTVGSGAISLNGSDAFIQLPATVANQQEITLATWVYWNGGSSWQRIFDFGNSQAQNMFLSPSSGSGELLFAIKNGGSEQQLSSSALSSGSWIHVAVTLSSSGGSMYMNGALVDESSAITISPLDFKPVLNYIGRSQYPDPLFNGYIDDFRIYNYALSSSEVADLAGNPNPEPSTGITSGNVYQIESKLSGKVMDVLGSSNGSLLIQFDNWNNDNQKWQLNQDSEGYWGLIPQNATGRSMDVPSCSFSNGQQLNIWTTYGNDCQKFQLVEDSEGYYQIQTFDGSKCVDVNGASLDNLAEIILWDCHSGDNQKWSLIDLGVKNASEPMYLSEGISIKTYPNPVENNLNIEIGNYSGQVLVDIYSLDGRLEKQVIKQVDQSGYLAIPHWGYQGLGLVKVTTDQEVKIFEISF